MMSLNTLLEDIKALLAEIKGKDYDTVLLDIHTKLQSIDASLATLVEQGETKD